MQHCCVLIAHSVVARLFANMRYFWCTGYILSFLCKIPGEGDSVMVEAFGEDLNNKWKKYYNRALGGENFTIKEHVQNPNGSTEYGLISFNPMYNEGGELFGVACYSKDITEDTLHLLALKESERRYSDLFHLSPQPMWVYELESLKFLNVNTSAIKHYGYSREEFLSMTIKEIRPIEYQDELEKAVTLHRDKNQPFSNGVFNHKKKSGEIQVEIQSNPILFKEKKCRIVLVNDITERERYIQAIESQNKKLNEIAWIQSHIVRSPLSRIMGLIDVMENYKVDEVEKTKIIKNILRSVHEFDLIVRDSIKKTEEVQFNNK